MSLTAISCNDDIIVDNQQPTSVSQNSNKENSNVIDLCSPFCCCACCAGFVVKPNTQVKSLASEISSQELNIRYSVSLSINHLSKIFQPPQV
jgi:hypothetical protein